MAAVMMLLSPLRTVGGNIRYTATYGGNVTIGTLTLGNATYSTVSYEGLYNMGDPGTPSLPVDYIKFSVPWNATNFSVSATTVEGETLSLDYPVCPIQGTPSGITTPNSDFYHGGTYPSQLAWYVNEGMMAGENHVVTVAVMPLIWVQANGINTLRQMESISLTLSYELSNTPTLQPLVRRGSSLREEGYEMTRGVVVNPDDVNDNAASHAQATRDAPYYPFDPPGDDIIGELCTYVIIAAPEAIRPMRRLAALKRQKGINVKLLTIDEAMNDSMSVVCDPIIQPEYFHIYLDDAELIRNNLRAYYYDHGCQYALLAGTDVPYRSFRGGDTDMYYCNLNSYWLTSAGNYGQLGVGRLLGTDSQQFDNYTDKLLRYELNPGNGDYSYLNRKLSIDFLGVRGIWDSNVQPTQPDTAGMVFDYRTDLTGQQVINLLRVKHYGLTDVIQLGLPSGFPLTLYGQQLSDASHYIWAIDTVKVAPGVIDNETGNGFNCMDNKLYPMVFTSCYGTTMPYHQINGYSIDFNCGKSFTMGKDYGGPAYVGSTQDVDYFASSSFEYTFLNKLKLYPIGDALHRSKEDFDNDENADIICNYNLLGDPTLETWTKTPTQYSNITVSRTDNSVTISGIGADNTIIGYHSNDSITGSTKTSSSSVTLTDVSPNGTIMLYKRDYIPYIAPMVLQNVTLRNSQYVIATDVTAGRSVDSGRTNGNVTVQQGAEYEIEASGKVTLAGGFKVERGAYFTVQKATFK